MMNLIYRQYTVPKTQHQPLIIEAPTGTGKSLGYTLPLAYLARHEDRQVVIATDTVLLQSQLMSQTLPLLNDILPFHINAVVVKGKQHYLDLNRFFDVLETSRTVQTVPADQTQAAGLADTNDNRRLR